MKTQATVLLQRTRNFLDTRKSAWQLYWTEERKLEITFVVTSFLLSGVFFWFALSSVY